MLLIGKNVNNTSEGVVIIVMTILELWIQWQQTEYIQMTIGK